MQHKIGLFLGLAFLTLAAGVARAEEDYLKPYFPSMARTPLVYIDDTVLTVYDFGTYLAGSGNTPTAKREKDLDTLRRALESFIDEGVIVRHLVADSILADPSAAHRGRWRVATAAGPAAFQHFIAPQIHVTDSAVEQYYHDSLASQFTAPKKREVWHMLFAPHATTQDGRRMDASERIEAARHSADSALAALKSGAPFDSLAGALSDDTVSRSHKGYLGWVYPGNTAYDFDTAAFHAEIGVPRGPIRTLYGFHIILVTGERPESTLALDDSVRYVITTALANEQARRLGGVWADSVIAAADWKFNADALADTSGLIPDATWMVVINGRDSLFWGEWRGAWEYYKRNQGVKGAGTPEDKRKSLKETGYPFLYLHAAEDRGYTDHPFIVSERNMHLRSEALRIAHDRLRKVQDSVLASLPEPDTATADVEFDRPLHLQMLRARDSADVWSAYKRLVGETEFAEVVRRYHANRREVMRGAWDLGWVGKEDLPPQFFGPCWILNVGKYTRPIETDSGWYIFRLADRRGPVNKLEEESRLLGQRSTTGRNRGAEIWRAEIRAGSRIRIDEGAWRRVEQLWRR
jgi:hypothetical protein